MEVGQVSGELSGNQSKNRMGVQNQGSSGQNRGLGRGTSAEHKLNFGGQGGARSVGEISDGSGFGEKLDDRVIIKKRQRN